MIINYDKTFIKQAKKSPSKIKKRLSSRVKLFSNNQYHPLLKNHTLTGKYQNCRSINITGDWRAIYTHINDKSLIFIALGTHSQLYR